MARKKPLPHEPIGKCKKCGTNLYALLKFVCHIPKCPSGHGLKEKK